MAIQAAAVWQIVSGVGKFVLEIPMIHVAIEHHFDNTTTKWDERVWHIFEKFAHIKSPEERSAAIVSEVDALQQKYDGVKKMVASGVEEPVAFKRIVGDFVMPGMEWVEP